MTGDLQASSKMRQGLEQVLTRWWPALHDGRASLPHHRKACAEQLLAWHLEQVAALLDESREDVAEAMQGTALGRPRETVYAEMADAAIAAIKQRAGMSS